MNSNPSADWLNPPTGIPELDALPPRQCPVLDCRSFLKRFWNTEIALEEDEQGREVQVVVYWNDCPCCGHRITKVV